jgi:hypothetical protein
MLSRTAACFLFSACWFAPTGVCAQSKEAPSVVDCSIGDQTVKLSLTGSAIRSKHFLKIYAIDSYVQQGTKIRSAEDMITSNQAKQLRIIMLKTVDGSTMAEAFSEIFRGNNPEPTFAEELATVSKILESETAKKGDTIWFTHDPKLGFRCKTAEGKTYQVPNVEFSKAIWGNYFGKHNAGEAVKKELLAKLPKE